MLFRSLVCATVALALASFAHADEPPPRAAKLTEREQLIEDALDRKVSLDAAQTEFAAVIRDLAKQAEFAISLDPEGLEEAGVTKDQLVTLKLPEMKLRSVLKVLLGPLHLAVTPTPTELLVTSQDRASEKLFVRIYPVKDLLERTARLYAGLADDCGSLIDAITTLIDPTGWDHHGGTGTIAAFGNCLVAKQSLETHRKIDRLLASWRTINQQATVGKSPAQIPVEFICDTRVIEEKLAAKLANSVDMEFGEYMYDLGAKLKLPLVLDPEGLEEAGVTLDQELKSDFREGTTRDVLESMLEPLHLAIVAMPEYVLITSEDKATELYAEQVRLYPMQDLMGKTQRPEFEGSGCKVDYRGHAFDSPDTMIDLITTAIEPDQWAANGGQAAIYVSNRDRIVMASCSDKAHRAIELILARLREEGTEAVISEVEKRSESEVVERTYHLYRARRALAAKTKETQTIVVKDEAKKEAQQPAAPTANVAGPLGTGMGGIDMSGSCYLGTNARPVEPVAGPIPTADEVAALMKEMLDDIDWSKKGAKLKPFHDVLIVRHRRAELKKIENFLNKIDAVPELQLPLWASGGRYRPIGQIIPVVGQRGEQVHGTSGGFFSVDPEVAPKNARAKRGDR